MLFFHRLALPIPRICIRMKEEDHSGSFWCWKPKTRNTAIRWTIISVDKNLIATLKPKHGHGPSTTFFPIITSGKYMWRKTMQMQLLLLCWFNAVSTNNIRIWVVPPPSNSHHQDYYIFSRGSQPKPSFATIASWEGGQPKILELNCCSSEDW